MVILFDKFNMPDDIYEVIFPTKQQQIVGKALVDFMKEHNGEVNRTEMSLFAVHLHEGRFETEITEPPYAGKKVRLSYNKRQFYDRILTPYKSMGIIQFDLYKKTYKLSDQFNKEMTRIGLMWYRELQKPLLKLKKR
jgi:hypothetical protein